ncbi:MULTISPECIES: hypothetical protein [Streptomyces]|uniref:hypothetical protein n=2 Tax=Streptomyces TaxID=1883 RepID=UPI0006F70D07|nr:hypothetical protein [Streptomyces sp. Root55]KQZ17715.1 hypothetical protein ASD51_31560 [Streptomyces sp. Root55]
MEIIPAYMHYSEFNSGWIVAADAMRLLLAELSPGSHTMTVVVDGESLTLPDRLTCTVQVEVPTGGGDHTVDRDEWETVMCLLAVGVADAEREGHIVVVSPTCSRHVTRSWDLWEGQITALPVPALTA